MPVKDQAAYRKKRREEGKDIKRYPQKPENLRAASKRYRLKHPERLKHKTKHVLTDDQKFKYRLSTKYDMTVDEYNKKLEEQEYACAICRRIVEGKLAVDHNHDTDEKRGLLCNTCNVGLGMFKDNPELLKLAVEYLLRYGVQ